MREMKPITIGLKGNLKPFIMGFIAIERRMEMKTFFITIGLFIIIGTAGSSDINAISLTQTIIYAFIGLATMCIGVLGRKGKKER
jgi:hypothetical protein